MADWGDALSGAGSGALAGFGAGGPLGAVIGGGIGLLGGLFGGEKQKMETYTDPNQGQMDAQINSLMSSHAGAQLAQNEAQGYRRDARAAFDTMQQNPGVSGNASVMSALYNKTQGTAADAITKANATGALQDQQSKVQGLQLAEGASKNRFSMAQYNNYVNQANSRPGFFQNILMQGISSLAGKGASKLAGGAAGGGGNDNDNGFTGGTGSNFDATKGGFGGDDPNAGKGFGNWH